MAQVKSRCRKSTIIIAGAFFVSPLAAAAFRAPSSSWASPSSVGGGDACRLIADVAAANYAARDKFRRGAPRATGRSSPRLHASVLEDSLEADEQEQLHGCGVSGDILGMVMERSRSNGVNGVNDIIELANGNGLNIDHGDDDRRQDEEERRPRQGPRSPMQQQQQQQRGRGQQGGGIGKRSTTRKNNTAMADPDFLRKRTETLLRITQASYKTSHLISLTSGNSGVGSLKVDKRTFDWLIDAWSYSGEDDAADNALSLLYRMEELGDGNISDAADGSIGQQPPAAVSPDVKSYTKVINAIAHSGRPDAGEMAEKVLKRMMTAASQLGDDAACDLRPNTFTYTYVIDAYARSSSPRAPHAAQRIVVEMERLRVGGDPEVRPTSRAWNSVISAWAQWEGEEMVSEIYLYFVPRLPLVLFFC